jgi:ribosomal protein S12 methylthiotransferase
VSGRFYLETLGCPKNVVDSEKLAAQLLAEGFEETSSPESADLVLVNTCAFIEAAREESIETILELAERRHKGARLVVTGCLAERAGDELADAMPEIDLVAGFGVPVTLRQKDDRTADVARLDLLELPRRPSLAPWAYVKIAEGCDRNCGFCAIPSFRGKQRSRLQESILAEVDQLRAREIVLVAQDLASYGRDIDQSGALVPLVAEVAARVDWVRLLYLYPSSLTDALIEAVGATGVPYFDLSLQHVSRRHVRAMRRWGSGERYLERIEKIRSVAPDAALRSSFILGYPGESEEDQDELLAFLEAAQLDWVGFFTYSAEDGTYAADLPGAVDPALAIERLREAAALQDTITAQRRAELVGTTTTVLVDQPGIARSYREAPEIDGIISVPDDLAVGEFHEVVITEANGPDLVASVPVGIGR